MPDSLALLAEAEKLAAVADAISGTYALELARVLRDLERQLRVLALEAQTGRQGALARAVRAQRLRRQIQLALQAAGYAKLAETATTASLEALVAQMEALRGAAQLAAFTSADLTRILALQQLAKLDLLQQGQAIAHAVWRTFAWGLLTQRPIADLLEDLAEALDIELHEARTLYDTQVSVFARQVEAIKARPDDVYVYLGPLDKKIRPFCFERVGKVYTREEIDTWDNGNMPGPPFLVLGGWNCRHTLVAVSKVSELRKLVGTNQRMPEVESLMGDFPGDRKAA